MPVGKNRDVFIGTLRAPADIDRAINEGRQAPPVRLLLPPRAVLTGRIEVRP